MGQNWNKFQYFFPSDKSAMQLGFSFAYFSLPIQKEAKILFKSLDFDIRLFFCLKHLKVCCLEIKNNEVLLKFTIV